MALNQLFLDRGPHAVHILADHQVLPASGSLVEVCRQLLVGESPFIFSGSRIGHLPVIETARLLF